MQVTTNLREERGKAIADQGDQIKKVNDHSFKVKSQSGSGFYEVKATPNGMTCDCPDFVYRGGKCKHIQATRYYLEIEKDTPTRHRYRKGPPNLYSGMERLQRGSESRGQPIR